MFKDLMTEFGDAVLYNNFRFRQEIDDAFDYSEINDSCYVHYDFTVDEKKYVLEFYCNYVFKPEGIYEFDNGITLYLSETKNFKGIKNNLFPFEFESIKEKNVFVNGTFTEDFGKIKKGDKFTSLDVDYDSANFHIMMLGGGGFTQSFKAISS